MAFKLKSGNKVDFKMMGSSPVRNMKDGDYSQSFEKSPMRKSPLHEETPFGVDPNEKEKVVKDPVETETETNETETKVTPGSNAGGDLSGLYGTKDGSPPTDVADNVADDKEKEKIMAQSKKEMYANAWQNSGIGHIVEAGKSIGRGIKNIRTKNKAKKAEKLTSAKEAIEDGTQTLKQQKRVDKAAKKSERKTTKASNKKAKDQEKLVKYKAKKSKKAVKKFKKNTVVKNGKTYNKQKKTTSTTPTDAELMAHHEANRKKQGKSTL
tara:strand:- start:259 stop:1059 length:801 start_codon:yes stop_codon:yes gene_type:complete